ncbi:restriction endonuclease subunit S [Lactococcus lactis]|uniref:restriction endonuclease subunit S n=1 Tax=Lactococcus lactis TaxID=1358 RepID=UPI0022E29442|nr:restriction endonuclease subunit S [Lactococcus lactis]
MSEWKNCTLGDLGEVVGGGTPSTKKPEYYGGDIAWITPKDLSTFSGRFIKHGERNITEEGLKGSSARLMPKNTILFSSRAPIGYVAIAENEVSTNQGFKSIVPNDDTDYLFLYYLLKFNKDKIENMGSGTTFKEVSGKTVKAIDVTVPSNKEKQHEIAKILGSLDDKIENNRKINHHLVELARSFWQERFSSKQPNGKLGDIIELFDSKRVPLSANQREKMDKTYPYYGATSLMDYVDDYLFDGTYLLLGEDGTVIDKEGYPILQYVWGKFWVNNHAHIMVGKNGFTVESLFVLLKNTCVSSIVTGAVQLKINQANLKSVDVYIPQKEELDNFNSTIEPIFDQLRNLYDEIKSLTTLRDALLPKLMSGEISVAD